MRKHLRPLLLTASILLLLSLGTIRNFEKNHSESPTNDATISRFNVSNLSSSANPSHILQVNNIAMGETIKNHLRNEPSVKLINHNNKNESHYIENEVVVKFKNKPTKTALSQIEKDINGKVLKNLNSTYCFQSDELTTSELIAFFKGKENIVAAEPKFVYLQNQIELPNDFFYQEQYQWNIPAIHTEKGWDFTKGDENVVIAVVDTGVDLNHPDLRGQLTEGYNIVESNNYPDDDNGHGTHVAGIIASKTNNREGIAGITWYNKIMPVKVMGAEGHGSSIDIAKGIVWAVDNGADVINLSLGNYEPSFLMEEAVNYAYDNNVVIVAAAGNDNTNQPSFPAAFPTVLSVSAVNYNGQRADFSNYGDYIDVTAPGVQIASTFFNQQYAALSGTSMASPHVAALAGLILSINPDLKNRDVMNVIKSTAHDLGRPGDDIDFGSGLIDVEYALEAAKNSL